jgi:hypothetical protein
MRRADKLCKWEEGLAALARTFFFFFFFVHKGNKTITAKTPSADDIIVDQSNYQDIIITWYHYNSCLCFLCEDTTALTI